MEQRSSRRAFLTGTAATAGALAAGVLPAGRSAAATKKPVYKLNPEWGAGKDGCATTRSGVHQSDNEDCHACRACHRHARNKLFSSRDAARKGKHRAHRHCKCRPFQGKELDAAIWRALFKRRDGSIRPSVDKRDPRVRAILGLDPLPR